VSAEERPRADATCDGGDLDCGSGLLLIIRDAITPLASGGVLEVKSREISVKEDLPAWCRMVGHGLLGAFPGDGRTTHYFIRKQAADASLGGDLAKARGFAWTARVKWTSGMQAKAFVRNHAFVVGQPASFDTQDAAPSAVEFLLSALGGCLAVGFAWRASQRGIEVRNLEVSLKAQADNVLVFLGIESDGHPGLRRVEGTIFVDADADGAVLDALWKETLERSPVAQSLGRVVPVDVRIREA
jgi:uncharacterized OsmC-like protein/TusA-related sulfurtransferase